MRSLLVLFICFISAIHYTHAQSTDTIVITEKNINTAVLREGTHRYLVYFKMKKDAPRTQAQFWTRKIERVVQDKKPVIVVTQEWEDKDSIMHTVRSVCDGKTMKPLTHEFWWKQRGSTVVDFEKSTLQVNGINVTGADTTQRYKAIWSAFKSRGDHYFLNWHMDLEVFPTLPYKKGATFLVPFYDPGTGAPFEKVAYRVTGSDRLQGYNDQAIDCWILVHESKGNREVFWISKKTKEVLKMEQEINGRLYRYKIKLGFSI